MLGEKQREFKNHPNLSLETLIPKNNFYRQLQSKVDIEFVRELVADCYIPFGRPSLDPVVYFKLHLIMFFEGIRSERQLMETVNLNLAHRWYIGYDLDESVPDHSSLSKIRDRYGLEIFQRFFEKIIELCRAAGLVWGKELYFDGTKVRANADLDSLEPRLEFVTQHHLQALFPEEASSPIEPSPPNPNPRRLLDKYDGTRISARDSQCYQRTTDEQVSRTDPDATPMKAAEGKSAALGYHTHYVVDGGKSRIILAALVTPASIMDNTPMLDLARWVCFRWNLFPRLACGDKKYGTVANIVGLEQDGIRAYLPSADLTARTSFYSLKDFTYDTGRDLFICPQGQELPFRNRNYGMEYFVYQAAHGVCNACPIRAKCTKSKTGRQLHRSFFQNYLDRVVGYRQTEAYKKALRKRQVWVEPLFGEAKQWHEGRRFRLRGLEKVNIEGLMRAAGQNIKRLLKARTWRKPLRPAASAALRPTFQWVFCLP